MAVIYFFICLKDKHNCLCFLVNLMCHEWINDTFHNRENCQDYNEMAPTHTEHGHAARWQSRILAVYIKRK